MTKADDFCVVIGPLRVKFRNKLMVLLMRFTAYHICAKVSMLEGTFSSAVNLCKKIQTVEHSDCVSEGIF